MGFFQTKRSQLPDHGISKAVQSIESIVRHTRAHADARERAAPAATDRATLPARNLHILPRTTHVAVATHGGQTHRRSTRSGPPTSTPQPDHVTSKRTPCRLRSQDRPPPRMERAVFSYCEGIRNTVTVHETAALMRGRLGRLGRLRATAISSDPLQPSLCIPLGAVSASVLFSDTRAHLARDQLTNLWRRRRLFIFHDQLHVPSPRKVLKLSLLKPLTPPFGPFGRPPLKRGSSSEPSS